MNLTKNVLSYYFKNFLYIALVTIIPAIFLGLLTRPFALFEFLSKASQYTINNFGDLFLAVYQFNWLSILWIVLGVAILVMYLCTMLGFIENHFRTGNATLRDAFKVNSNVLSVVKSVFILLIGVNLVNILALFLIYFIYFLTASAGVATVLTIILSYIIAIAALYPIARMFSVMSFATAEMIINGSLVLESISNGFSMVSKQLKQVFLTEITIFVTSIVVVTGFSLLGVAWLGNILGVFILLPLVCVFAMEMFFDYYGLKKYNNRKYYNFR